MTTPIHHRVVRGADRGLSLVDTLGLAWLYRRLAQTATQQGIRWMDHDGDYTLYDTQNPAVWLSTDARIDVEAVR